MSFSNATNLYTPPKTGSLFAVIKFSPTPNKSILASCSINDFIKLANKTRYSYYPVLNKRGKCNGIIRFSDVGFRSKKNVILVDHNSYEQSAIGLEEANILEIIDHHNIGTIGTNMPISFRNMPVGSTNTILYTIFKENNIPEDDYEVVLSDNNVRITYNKKYDSIEEYLLNSRVYHELIDEIQFNKSNNYIDLYVNQKLKVSNDNGIKMNGTNLVDLDVLQINIENPFDVNFSNAEIVNDNVYTWTIKKGDTEKKIQMQFKPSLNIFPYKQVAVLSTVIVCILIIIFTIYGRYKKRQKI